MTSQANITDYFNARKRASNCDASKSSRAKVLILEAQKCLKPAETSPKGSNEPEVIRTCPRSKPKVSRRAASKSTGRDHLKQSLLTNFTLKPSDSDSVEQQQDVSSPDKPVRRSLFGAPSTSETQPQNKSLDEITKKLKSSKKAEKLRESLARFTSLGDKLKKAQEEELKLKQFTTIDVEVPLSPVRKVPFGSPAKEPPKLLTSSQLSPSKALGNRLAAWQQHKALAESRLPTLPLPWKLRSLEEIFRGIDVVSSMMLNRRETVTLDKLKPAVQKISKLNFCEDHLGQIQHLYPEAFALKIDKRKTFALTGRADVYDLVVTPNFDMQSDEGRLKVAPKVLQSRAEHFHDLLVKHVMTCHQAFLSHLDPPLIIAENKVTRWHPGFDLEQVPALPSEPLPKPPNQNGPSSAQKLLDKAKEMMSCNARVMKALSTYQSQEKTPPTPTPQSNVPLNPAFRGIPSALLEKVRAKQAARALEAMTRTPAEDEKRTRLARLPELARVLRSVFVAEKRGVMQLDTVLQKLEHSYTNKMPTGELIKHLDLLTCEAPELLQRLLMRQTVFLKLDRQVNMAAVMTQLEKHILT